MEFENSNERRGPQVTTYGPNFTNKESLVRLSFTYADNNLLMNMVPLKDQNDFNSLADKSVYIQVSGSTASQIAEELREAKDAFKLNEPFNTTVLCGIKTTNGIGITDGSNINKPYGIYLVFYKNLDGSKKPEQMMVYPFRSTVIMNNFDPTTGKFEEKVKPFREVKDVIHALEDFARGSNKAKAHVNESVRNKKSELGMLVAAGKMGGANSYKSNKPKNDEFGFNSNEDYFGNSLNSLPF